MFLLIMVINFNSIFVHRSAKFYKGNKREESMTPNIFIEDFERTENSDYLHGVLGRALIIATRFDSSCVALSKAKNIELQIMLGLRPVIANVGKKLKQKISKKIKRKILKYQKLSEAIRMVGVAEDELPILIKANGARNIIAHELTKGLEGCLDSKVGSVFINEVSKLIGEITDGDIVISKLISKFNGEPILNTQEISKYKEKVINWVIKAE